MDEYPPNSDASKKPPEDEKKVERVTSSEPIRRRKSLGKQFKATFFGGDAKSAFRYVVFDVLIPAAKDAIADAGAQGIERLVFGDTRRRRGAAPPSGPSGYVSYNRYAMGGQQAEPPRSMSRRARASHNFDEIVLTSRPEAEEVLDRMYDIISRYEAVTVADLYGLTGIQETHTDYKWGWSNLHGSGVARVRNGYLLDLPDPEPMTN